MKKGGADVAADYPPVQAESNGYVSSAVELYQTIEH